MNGSTERTERTERTGRTENLRAGVCNEWIINEGWACFLYIVYILCVFNKYLYGPTLRAFNIYFNIRPTIKGIMNIYLKKHIKWSLIWAFNINIYNKKNVKNVKNVKN